MKSKSIIALLVLAFGTFSTAFGRVEAPVIDLNRTSQDVSANQALEIDQDEPAPARAVTHQHEAIDQRVLRLERQVSNINDFNYATKTEKLQQEIQQLHGQLEVQSHELTQIKEQLRSFYQDLDQRLAKMQTNDTPSTVKKTATVEVNQKETEVPNQGSSVVETTKSQELQNYETAFNFLNKKEYDKAITGFQSFVKQYPASSYTGNAHYWLGEIYYLKDKSSLANKEFQYIITNYPDNTKVADATLKLALIAMSEGNYTKAKNYLTKVQKQYPGTTAAKIATLRLKEVKQKH